MPPTTSQRPLGALLVEMGFVNPTQLEAALSEQQRSKKRLGKLLIEAGIITEDRLVHALSHQLGIEACDPIMTPVHEAVLAMIPSKLAFQHRILPVARQRDGEAEILYVATADPLDQAAGSAVRQAVPGNTQVRWMLAGETEMDLALARHYGAAPTEAKKKKPESEAPVRVIAGRPVAPPRRPDERPMSPLSSTGDIFAALQEAVDFSADVPTVPTETGPIQPRRAEPEPSRPSMPPISSSGDLEVVFPTVPAAAQTSPSMGPEPSHPSLDLARLGGRVQDDISEEILEAEEVIESGVHPVPDEVPTYTSSAASAEAAPEPEPPAPADDDDPVVPPVEAPVVPAGPSWADMVGGGDDDEEDDDDDVLVDDPGDSLEESDELQLARLEAAALPNATDSLARMPAPSGLPPEPSAPPLPSGPAPTPLDLSAPLDLAAATGPTEPEPAASLADLAPAEDDELDFIGMSEDVSVDVPPFQASASQELGLDGLPLDAPPREALPDLETVEDVGAGAADSFLAPAAAVPRLDSASDEEGEWRDTDVDLDALSLSAGVAPLGAEVPPGAPAALEDAPPEEVAPSVSEAAPLPDTVRARDLVSRFVTGEDIEQVDLQWVFRLLGAAMLAGPLADDDALAAALDQVGPPP